MRCLLQGATGQSAQVEKSPFELLEALSKNWQLNHL
jgi:hypothetical protein